MSDDRIVIPKGADRPRPFHPRPKEEVDLARILTALQRIDENMSERARDLMKLLVFLPLIWAAIGFVLGIFFFAFRMVVE